MKIFNLRSIACLLVLSTLSFAGFTRPPVELDPCIEDLDCPTASPLPSVYAVGTVYTPNWQAAMWVDGVRTDLPPLVNAYNTGAKAASSIFVVDNFATGQPDVYVAGTANITTNNAVAADSSAMIWKNGEVFSQIPSISSTYVNQFAGATSLFIENGNIYSGGYTDKKGSISGPANNLADMKPVMWKNGLQSLLPLDPSAYRGTVNGIYVRNGNTYAIGNHSFTVEGGPSNPYGSQEVWINNVLIPGGNTGLSELNAVFATSSKLYLAGTSPLYVGQPIYNRAAYIFRSTSLGAASNSTSPFYGVWLNSNGNKATATGIVVVGTKVYVVGWELRPSNKYVAKLWINGTGIDLSDESESAVATCLYVHGNDVYVGGSTNNIINQRPKAVIWKNGLPIDLNGSELGSHITSIFVK
ncbi:MAG: hypothetical protein ACREPB_02515 [Arenimonas sp.]